MSDIPVPPPAPRQFGDLAALTGMARLPLDEERLKAVGGILADVYGILDVLDDVELDNVLPATHFDARWE
ncbi:hypothetical protein ACQP1K_23090 [Sphaerimonospora sp. CA-214678]|uniref:hypothetical protein n=1 Tax=Sphaerimonospora sp. CA-214678 TaxID=3240029 RepID=UPI003D8DBFED